MNHSCINNLPSPPDRQVSFRFEFDVLSSSFPADSFDHVVLSRCSWYFSSLGSGVSAMTTAITCVDVGVDCSNGISVTFRAESSGHICLSSHCALSLLSKSLELTVIVSRETYSGLARIVGGHQREGMRSGCHDSRTGVIARADE
jgi:hypothetical protein